MSSRKTFLIINQTAGSQYHGMVYRNYYIAREWVKEGHRAIIISGSYFHNFSKSPTTTGLFTKEMIDGIEYWWVKLPSYSQSRSFGRLFTVFLFPFLLLFFPFWKLGRPETVIVSGPPHLSIVNAWIWARMWGAFLVYEVRDIWPLTIVKLGNIHPWHPVILLLSFFERLAYKVSDKVVSVLALAQPYFVSKGMLPSKFAYIPNGVDTSNENHQSGDVSSLVCEITKTKKVIIYAGSFGIANNLDQFIDAASMLESREDLHFVLVGDGPYRKNLEKKAKNLKNVSILGPVPKREISDILSYAHIGYVGLMKSDLFKHGVSPNKLFDYMAASRPVIMAIDTEDDIVGKAGCGILVPSCSPEDIVGAIKSLADKPLAELNLMGVRGRQYLEKNHTYKALAKKYLEIADEGCRVVGAISRLKLSPVWTGFVLVMLLGLFVHLVPPLIFPNLFDNGIIVFLNDLQPIHDQVVSISSQGWSEFNLRPSGNFAAGLLAFIYKVTGIHRPLMFLPILGLLAGLTVSSILACLELLGVRGRWWPLLIAVLFTVTPTSISWMIYPHKEAFIVPGVVLMAWSLMAGTFQGVRPGHLGAFILGSILVFSNKPHFSELFFVGVLAAAPFAWGKLNSIKENIKKILFFSFCLVLVSGIIFKSSGYLKTGKPAKKTQLVESMPGQPRHIETKEKWKKISGGTLINKPLLALAYTRERYLFDRSYGNTNFMPEVHLTSAWETIKFIPRALQLAILEPLPWRENDEDGVARSILFSVVQFEMVIVYASILFLLFSGRSSWNSAVFIALALSIPFLFSLGFATPNVGAINRYRFPFLLLIKIAGFAALWNSSRFKWPGKLLFWIDPPEIKRTKKKVLFLVPDDATFLIQRLVMAQGVKNAGYEVHVAAEDTGVSDKIRELGFTFHNLDLNRGGLNPFADFWPFMRLVLFLSRQRPDILQCVSIKPVLYGATAGTIVGLNRIVCLINGLGYAFEGSNVKGKVVKAVAKALYRNALTLSGIRVIFQNPDDRAYFVDNKLVAEHKTLLIRGSGVNMEKFKPLPQPQNPGPVILFVGRLLWSKGIRELVEAAQILKKEKLNFVLQIVGSPDDRNPEAVSTSFMNEHKEDGSIHWLGRQTDMPRFYREADIVCLPTQYKEGLPLTLLEAASTGRALVATDVPGCREIVRNGENGFLIAPKSVDELVHALRELILHPELRSSYGEASSRIVKEEFAAEIIQHQLVSVYESLLNDSVSLSDNRGQCLVTS